MIISGAGGVRGVRPEVAKALEFAQAVDRISSLQKLDVAMRNVLKPFGVTNYGAHRVFDPGHLARPGLLFGTVPREWEKRYTSAGHVRADPAVRMLFETTRPYTWTEARTRFQSRESEQVMEECREIAGTAEGLVVPIHEVDGSVLTALFSGPDMDFGPDAIPALHLLGYYYVLRGRELLSKRNGVETPNRLTPRQAECLKWVAEGKTDEEIGRILSLSERTVHNHIEAAKRGLGVTKRSQAAMLAYRRGWIS
jgi:LuxR family quorum sensing-dependent transcriptional regulator